MVRATSFFFGTTNGAEVKAAERFQIPRPHLEQRETVLLRRQMVGGVAADHFAAVITGFSAQRNPKRDVGLDLLQRRQVQPLTA